MRAEPQRIVVVGASAAGLSAAEALRRGGYANKLTIIGAETHRPYDRPPLSKQYLTGEWDAEKVMLRPAAHLEDLDVDSRLGIPASGLDIDASRVVLTDGTEVGYDTLILATGVSPKTLPNTRHLRGVHTLRTLDDADGLRDELHAESRVIIIGAGFLGTEIAAVAALRGARVTLIGNAAPLAGILGPDLGAQLGGLHASHGVTLKAGPEAAVASVLHEDARATGVVLRSGEVLLADVVVMSIGSVPAVGWLRTSGLSVADGVSCTTDLSAAPGIYAAGDVARWHNTRYDVSMRLEHRINAVDQGIHVAEQILAGTSQDYTPVPYFWSDQYDLKLQSYGWLRDHDEMLVTEGSLSEGKFVALFRRGGRLTGVLGARSHKALRTWRQYLCDGASWGDTLDAA
ncbi:NAD(P)/FAD-dependent oxidoreductase [Arthrobacter sp. HS15c]|uniref:NAD(P)/FAD-dependent oxidoreductase n=1 Tax=Arthrobacter sp. HS15c TaxID=3230279 RepID=UPI003465D29F